MSRIPILGLALIGLVALAGLPDAAEAQPRAGMGWSFAVETEPVPYALGGAGGTLAYRTGPWTVSLEGFSLDVPESIHGNEGFDSSNSGLQVQLERFVGGGSGGLYLGPEIGVSELEVTHEQSGVTEKRVGISAGARLGYHWRTGLGGIYLSPVAGVGYSFAADDLDVGGGSYEISPVTPWATVGVGWSF